MPIKKTVGARSSVIHGNAEKTSGGLRKEDLKRNKSGKIVSRKNSTRAKREQSPLFRLWGQSVAAAYDRPKYRGKFIALKKGTPFYKVVNAEYKLLKEEAGYSATKKKTTKKRRTTRRLM